MNTKLNPKLLDSVKMPSSNGELPIRTGTIVEVLNTPPNTVLVEVADDEGVLRDLIVSESATADIDWRVPESIAQTGDEFTAEAFFEQGVLLLQNGLITKAKTTFDKAFRIDPRYAGTLMNLANESASRGASEVAAFLYQMILELQPNYRLALENLAITHLNRGVEFAKRGVMDKAIEEFNQTLLLDPARGTLELCQHNLVAAYTSLGMQLAKIKRYQEGMQFFLIAFQLDPTEHVARRNLALALVAVAALEYGGRGIPSAESFKRFILMGLTLSECLNAYGATLAGLGRMEDARATLQKATQADPRNELAAKNLAILESPGDSVDFPLGITPFETHGAQVSTLR